MVASVNIPDYALYICFAAGAVLITFFTIFAIWTCRKFRRTEKKMRCAHAKRGENPTDLQSPTEDGKFRNPVWCQACNRFYRDVYQMCPHVQQRLFVATAFRHFAQLRCPDKDPGARKQSAHAMEAAINDSNVTIDLDDLIKAHGWMGDQSTGSDASSSPSESPRNSTPNSIRSSSRVRNGRISVQRALTSLAMQRPKFSYIRRLFSFTGHRPMESSVPSSAGVDVAKSKSSLRQQKSHSKLRRTDDVHSKHGILCYLANANFAFKSQIPTIKVRPPSIRQRRHSNSEIEHGDDPILLRPDGSWGARPCAIRRSISQPAHPSFEEYLETVSNKCSQSIYASNFHRGRWARNASGSSGSSGSSRLVSVQATVHRSGPGTSHILPDVL